MYAQAQRFDRAERSANDLSKAHAELEAAFAVCVRALLSLSTSNEEQALRVGAAAQLLAPADSPRPTLAALPQSNCAQSTIALTRREREVAELLTQGHSNREIAERLVVSERTVDTHVQNLLSKLQLHSRSHVGAALRALDARQIVRIDTPSRTPSRR
jgi:DNA-binding NarL/FixJ family response regulator